MFAFFFLEVEKRLFAEVSKKSGFEGQALFGFAFINQEVHIAFQLRQHGPGKGGGEPQHRRGIGDGRGIIGQAQRIMAKTIFRKIRHTAFMKFLFFFTS